MPSYQQTLLAAAFHALAFVTTVNAATDLGTAAAYGALAASDLTSTGLTIVNGDIGVSPGTSITGFPPGVFTGIESAGDPAAATAQSDAHTAYLAAQGLPCGTVLTGQDLGGQTLGPGVYCFASSASLTGILTLDAGGNPNAQFVFQIGSTLTTATGSQVLLIGGAQACGVTWAVGSSATLGTGTSFAGDILAEASITLNSNVVSNGGLYALTGGITLIDDTITTSGTTCTGVVTTSTASVTPSATSSLSSTLLSSTLNATSTIFSSTHSTLSTFSTISISTNSTLSMSGTVFSSSHTTSKPSSTTSSSNEKSSKKPHPTKSSSSTLTTKVSTPSSTHHTTTSSSSTRK